MTSTKVQRLSYEHATMAVVKMYVVPMIIKRKYNRQTDKHCFFFLNLKIKEYCSLTAVAAVKAQFLIVVSCGSDGLPLSSRISHPSVVLKRLYDQQNQIRKISIVSNKVSDL